MKRRHRYVMRRRHHYPYEVPDPIGTRLREFWFRRIWCPLFGHDTIIKMDGTRLCRRH